MCRHELMAYAKKHNMTIEEMLDYALAYREPASQGDAIAQESRELFIREALRFFPVVERFRAHQNARKPWNLDRTFRDLAELRRRISTMELVLCTLVEEETRPG